MRRDDGFTLVEVLLASAIMLTVLLGVATMSLTAQSHLARSGQQTAATMVSRQRVEWLRNQGYASSDLAAGTTTETLTGTYAGYTRTTTVLNNTPRAGVKQVTVTTTAPSGVGVTVVSLVAE